MSLIWLLTEKSAVAVVSVATKSGVYVKKPDTADQNC